MAPTNVYLSEIKTVYREYLNRGANETDRAWLIGYLRRVYDDVLQEAQNWKNRRRRYRQATAYLRWLLFSAEVKAMIQHLGTHSTLQRTDG